MIKNGLVFGGSGLGLIYSFFFEGKGLVGTAVILSLITASSIVNYGGARGLARITRNIFFLFPIIVSEDRITRQCRE